MRVPREAEAHVGHAWLPALLPAHARRLLVPDPVLAREVRDAGAEIVEDAPDAEIGRVSELVAQAPFAASPIGEPDPDARSLAGRVGSRVASAISVRVQATRAGRGLRHLGYETTEVFSWDLGHPLALDGMGGSRSLAERLPRRAVVIGRNGPREPTLLEAAVADAAGAVRRPLRVEWASARAGPTTAALDDGLLRIAVGPCRNQLQRQGTALATLHEALPPEGVELIPRVEAQGRTGIADWSLEQRLPGGPPAQAFSDRLLGSCVDFLVLLHRARGTTDPEKTLTATAESAAEFCPPSEARAIVALGEGLEATLAGVPRGFAHGDFFRGNLLVEQGRLVGVVDWDASGPGRLPLIDLLHLRHMNEQRPEDLNWGPTLVEHLVPWARAGGDDPAREYCRRVGVDPLPERLEGLVAAYWLDRVAYQLSTYADRAGRPKWLERNVAGVLQALVPRFVA